MRVGAVAGELAAHELERRHLEVELVGVVLVDDGDARLRLALNLALGRLERARDQLDERRLAVAVLAEEHDARARVHRHLRALEEHPRASVAEAHLLQQAGEADLPLLLGPRGRVDLGTHALRVDGRGGRGLG